MHDEFVNLANAIKNECLLKTEALFVANMRAWFDAFSEHFRGVCGEIRKMQEEHTLSAISYLEYTMLYTNFINRKYISEVLVYGDEYCLDENQRIVGEYDIAFLFVYFDELWDRLNVARKRFAGKVTSLDVKAFMLKTITDFYSYLTNIARFAIADCVDDEPFASIAKGNIFVVSVGEYMAKTEPVFTENKNKNAAELTDWFLEELDEVYMCGDYSSLDFSEKSFEYNNYCYAHFRNSYLNNTSLKGAMLIGTSFRGANMEGCCLDNASINEADFSNANLKNASFVNIRAKVGITDESEWKYVGFIPISFCDADLSGVNFEGANLTGADFSGAVLTGTDFTGAIVDSAIFSGGDLPLTDDQRSKIIMSERF